LRSLLTTGLVAAATVLSTLITGPSALAAPARIHTVAAPAPTSTSVAGSVARGLAAPAATTTAYTELNDVACIAADNCVAVGDHFASGKSLPLSRTWNGTKWTTVAVPLPSGATAGFLSSISCASTAGCYAVGAYTRGSIVYGLAENWSGFAWGIVRQPAVVSGASQVVLESVSCVPSISTNCIATGYYVPSSNKNIELALAEVYSGTTGTWRSVGAPHEPYSNLDSISCPAQNDCILGGLYVTAAGSYVWAEHFDGVHWSAVSVPQPTTANAHFQFFSGVSCSSVTSCMAVGVSVNTSNHSTGFIEQLVGTTWKVSKVTWPAGAQTSLNAVSCAQSPAINCIAVGGDGAYATLAGGRAAFATFDGTTWTTHIAPAPGAGHGNVLFGVQCMSATYCALTGSEGTVNTNTGVGLGGIVNAGVYTWKLIS
jgi:hypothetical protein